MENTTTATQIATRRFSWKTLLVGVVLGIVLFIGGTFALLLGSYTFFRKEAITKMAEAKELKPLLLRADLNWSVKDLNGESVDLKTFAGHPLLLHFWNPACVSCIAEIPSLNSLYETFQAKGLTVAGIALYADDELAIDVAQYGVRFPVYSVDKEDIPSFFQLSATPTTFIIDQDGFVALKHAGAVDWSNGDGAAFVEALLAR